ncbi:hypothetical protein SAMN06265338_101177 [Rhodoblastus acidophilus]|uniref:Uncharacterized protein n=1 Tax=Rhodoblastus acidophilus TaxID=1074 RepID=A0A212PYC8_RHOAC|nr:hypothetical protein [Rhodoblastus acidophilus]SNB52066.1 hypothetical protein SAMN06265338_101177 [Rhodoblastus acidophilus]
MVMRVETGWNEVTGFAGFALFLTAVKGSADPCSKAMA